MVTTSCV